MEIRKLNFEWVMQKDGSRALLFYSRTWDTFENAARSERKDPCHLISADVAQYLRSLKVDDYICNRSKEH